MNIGITQAASAPIINPAPRTVLTGNNLPRTSGLTKVNNSIPALNSFEVKCLLLQISYMETSSNIAAVSGDRLGQYHVTEYLLEKYGYLDSNGWTGLDGIDEEELFLDSSSIQDKIMLRFISETYPKLIQTGALRANDTKEIVAGMLAVAYQFQDAENPNLVQSGMVNNEILALLKNESNSNYNCVKAQIWRDRGFQQDSLGRPGSMFFQAGKYAVQNLAADYTES